jgi:hypothetical protein
MKPLLTFTNRPILRKTRLSPQMLKTGWRAAVK